MITLLVHTEEPRIYAASLVEVDAPAQYPARYVCAMSFAALDDLCQFVITMKIKRVTIRTKDQAHMSYGYRLDARLILDSISLLCADRPGRKPIINVVEE